MMIEAVEEHLCVAEWCISNHKADGGIYGYSAATLLFCVVEAIGRCLRRDREPFQILSVNPFNLKLSITEIGQIKTWYRNLLMHNAIIAPGVCMTSEDTGNPIEMGKPVTIRVKPLFALVRRSWDQLDKKKLEPAKRTDPHKFKGIPIGSPFASQVVNAAVSASIVTPHPTGGTRKK